MIKRADRRSTPWLLQAVFRLFPCVAAAVVLVIASRSSPATDQVESRSPGVCAGPVSLAAAGPTPTPFPCPLCLQQLTFSENFDGVVPPALPPGWLATNAQGPPPLWVGSNSGVPLPPADTAPNAAMVDDPGVLSDKRLDSPQFTFFEGGFVRLTFRHNFNLEASEQNQGLGYDGGVLEVSGDGGNTFQDILVAGGSFVVGGYNRSIATDRGSPIAGRQAWSGNSGGFITTVVNVPAFQTPSSKIRWRMASDSTGSGEGWRVDTVHVTWCHGQGTPCPTPTPARKPAPSPRPRPTPAPRP